MGFTHHDCCQLFGQTGNLLQALNSSVIVENMDGFNTIGARVTAPTGGEITFEASFDGTNWEPVSLRSIKNDVFTSVTDNDEDFIGSIAGARRFRFRVSTGGSAPGTVIGSLVKEVSTLEGIEFGWPPHRFGFAPIHKDASYTTAQTGTALWTPASGKTYYVTDLAVIVGGTTDGTITIFDNTDAAGNRLFKAAVEVATNKQFRFVQQLRTPFFGAAVDNVLKITTSAAMTVDVMLHGYEV